MELKTYVCPNCGANTTNAQNCEYCGSLLVRFVEKGIDVKSISYLNSNDWVFPGLIENLQKNLQLQADNPEGTDVRTDICGGEVYISVFSPAGKLWTWDDGTVIDFTSTNRGLLIILTFYDVVYQENKGFRTSQMQRPSKYMSKLLRQDSYKRNFKDLEMYPIFMSREYAEDFEFSNGYETHKESFIKTSISYAIDFGQDAEGAARLISRILLKVYGVSRQNNGIRITTNAGALDIEKAAKENNSIYTGIDKDFDSEMNKKSNEAFIYNIIGIIVVIFSVIVSFVGC
ncbi:MAG: hypothetical protein IJK51_06815 [Bacteroidaceae bacterium]|nr:hypothetical protein [Bacteroidaceae bacterium]